MKIHVVETRNNVWRIWKPISAHLDLQTALATAEAEGEDEAWEPLGSVTTVKFKTTKLELCKLIATM